eukprot:CAMPEP_0181335164 /NCGR_PEP_ID=MMETSP1101-20121128/26679_1 /TAXON_ID=46948 /ORGANISM="Rhodomonas abbreviata, Strain Caron Lab Isolate" /LENGTH=42 /DNA_ID= /DNA_START= /DNA_END= /DNA_ORIENTATION=
MKPRAHPHPILLLLPASAQALVHCGNKTLYCLATAELQERVA